MRLLCTALACLISVSAVGQTSGCTDQNAFNFNEAATNNDGSCCYETINTYQLGQTLYGSEGGDQFGYCIAINKDGDVIVIASKNENNSFGYGVTRVYENINGVWNQRGQI